MRNQLVTRRGLAYPYSDPYPRGRYPEPYTELWRTAPNNGALVVVPLTPSNHLKIALAGANSPVRWRAVISALISAVAPAGIGRLHQFPSYPILARDLTRTAFACLNAIALPKGKIMFNR